MGLADSNAGAFELSIALPGNQHQSNPCSTCNHRLQSTPPATHPNPMPLLPPPQLLKSPSFNPLLENPPCSTSPWLPCLCPLHHRFLLSAPITATITVRSRHPQQQSIINHSPCLFSPLSSNPIISPSIPITNHTSFQSKITHEHPITQTTNGLSLPCTAATTEADEP